MIFLTTLATMAACTTPDATEAPAPVATAPTANLPDLVIVAVGGLREDAESHAGDRFLAAFGGNPSLRFSNAYAVSPNPYVSLGTILSGRYPTATPLCGLTAAPGPLPDDAPWCNHWPKSVPSLPGVLALYGYRTALVAANIAGAAELGKQFQHTLVTQETWSNTQTNWSALTTAAKLWWTAEPSRPRLLVVATSDLAMLSRPDLLAVMHLGPSAGNGQVDRRIVVNTYADAAAAAGKGAAGVVAALSDTSARERYVVLTGLHGINMGEASNPWQALRDVSWNDILLDRTVHVPLAILTPDRTQPTTDGIVELIDIVPSLLGRTNAVLPAGLHGQDLLSPTFTLDPDATAYSEFGDMLAVRQGKWMWSGRAFNFNRSSLDPELTDFFVRFSPDSPKFHLNDLSDDPYQRKELLSAHLDEARRMNALLLSIRTGPGAAPPTEMDARRIWDLRMSPADGYW